MKFFACLLSTSLFLFVGQQLHAEQAIVLDQPDAPISISRYVNRYKTPARVGDGTVMHSVDVKNVSNQNIDAFGVGFYIFDSFNRDMGRPFIGYSMTPITSNSDGSARFEQRPRSAFLFERNGQGISYIAIVRLADGSIWKADNDNIARQIEDFELLITGDAVD